MNTLAPFLISIILPGIGHFFLKKYVRGFFIFALCIGVGLIFPPLSLLFVIIALVDLYYIMEKESGRKAASRRLIFSLLIALLVIPGFYIAFSLSFLKSSEYATNHYFNERNTIKEMDKIAAALESYHGHQKQYPASFAEFVNTKPIWKNWQTDAWSNLYQYELTETTSYTLISAGEDQVYGTEDDLIIKSAKAAL
jgi:4-amino-4-deoxy-L-arabinose transferase-like glycosyltransferase